MAYLFFLTGLHEYLTEALVMRDRLGKTRLELQETLRAIEGVEPAPAGITVARSVGPATEADHDLLERFLS